MTLPPSPLSSSPPFVVSSSAVFQSSLALSFSPFPSHRYIVFSFLKAFLSSLPPSLPFSGLSVVPQNSCRAVVEKHDPIYRAAALEVSPSTLLDQRIRLEARQKVAPPFPRLSPVVPSLVFHSGLRCNLAPAHSLPSKPFALCRDILCVPPPPLVHPLDRPLRGRRPQNFLP